MKTRTHPFTTHRSLLTLLAWVVLAGCASLEKTKESWQGAHYDEVIARWGASSRSTITTDGRHVHTWVSEGGYYGAPGSTSVGVFGGSGGVGVGVGTSIILGGGGPVEVVRCERTLVFQDARVVEQTWLGDPTLCSEFRKE